MDLRAILKAIKVGELVPPQLKNTGAFAGNTYYDTLGLAAMIVLMHTGAVDAAIGSDDATTAVKLEECDTTDGTYTAITSAALAAVIGATEDNTFHGIALDLSRSHKRYVQIDDPTAGTGTTGCNFAAIAIGFPSDALPFNAAGMGLAELIQA